MRWCGSMLPHHRAEPHGMAHGRTDMTSLTVPIRHCFEKEPKGHGKIQTMKRHEWKKWASQLLPRCYCPSRIFLNFYPNLALIGCMPRHASVHCTTNTDLPYHSANYIQLCTYFGARGSAVGWSTALQAGMSQVRFPMVSLEFLIDIILPAALWPWGWLSV